jgi:bacterioferritin-associated ferredoxin
VYVCICQAVTEDEVIVAARSGADTLGAVAEATAAGSNCGTCHDTIEAVIERICPRTCAAFATALTA